MQACQSGLRVHGTLQPRAHSNCMSLWSGFSSLVGISSASAPGPPPACSDLASHSPPLCAGGDMPLDAAVLGLELLPKEETPALPRDARDAAVSVSRGISRLARLKIKSTSAVDKRTPVAPRPRFGMRTSHSSTKRRNCARRRAGTRDDDAGHAGRWERVLDRGLARPPGVGSKRYQQHGARGANAPSTVHRANAAVGVQAPASGPLRPHHRFRCRAVQTAGRRP